MPLKQPITADLVFSENKVLWDAAKEKWGNVGWGGPMDIEDRTFISKVNHALWVLEKWDQHSPADRLLASYGIPENARKYVIEKFCVEEELGAARTPAKQVKRADKYAEFEKWAEEHVGEQFTTEQLVEQCGFSYPTTLKYLKESLVFKQIKKGVWEATSGVDSKFSS